KKRGILWQGIRQLNVTFGAIAMLFVSYPKWKDRVATFGLRFKGVSVEGGSVVTNVEIMQPVEIMQHETRTKSRCSPIAEIMIDLDRFTGEISATLEQPSVVPQVVNPHLKTVLHDVGT